MQVQRAEAQVRWVWCLLGAAGRLWWAVASPPHLSHAAHNVRGNRAGGSLSRHCIPGECWRPTHGARQSLMRRDFSPVVCNDIVMTFSVRCASQLITCPEGVAEGQLIQVAGPSVQMPTVAGVPVNNFGATGAFPAGVAAGVAVGAPQMLHMAPETAYVEVDEISPAGWMCLIVGCFACPGLNLLGLCMRERRTRRARHRTKPAEDRITAYSRLCPSHRRVTAPLMNPWLALALQVLFRSHRSTEPAHTLCRAVAARAQAPNRSCGPALAPGPGARPRARFLRGSCGCSACVVHGVVTC